MTKLDDDEHAVKWKRSAQELVTPQTARPGSPRVMPMPTIFIQR